MAVNIIIFGQLTDITGTGNLQMEQVPDTDSLAKELHSRFPALSSMNYRVALNTTLVNANTPVPANATIALLPPFSGG